jgi:hypothetical protein
MAKFGVLFEVRTEFLNIIWTSFGFKGLIPLLTPNYKQHILSPAKMIKPCYSLGEIYVKYVYLNSFWWRGRDVHHEIL